MESGNEKRHTASSELERRLAESDARARAAGALREAVDSMAEDANVQEGDEQPAGGGDDLEALRRKADEHDAMQHRMLRALADLDNLQKRFRREVDQARRQGADTLLKALLPVFDNLELSLSAAETSHDLDSLVTGIRMILEQFRAALAERGIRRTGEVGESFDPKLHEAIGTVDSTEHAPGTIAA
ncbi:MAG: nucleotide exchange factor GrpE, partial [Planctomycetota bacterium]